MMTIELHSSDIVTVVLAFILAVVMSYISVRMATRALVDTVVQEIERHRAEVDQRHTDG